MPGAPGGRLEAVVSRLAPGRRGCIVTLVTASPREVEYYRAAILAAAPIAHLTVEVHRCTRRHVPAA